MISLNNLVLNIDVVELVGSKDRSISKICFDSRKVKKGYIFAVFKGSNKNGINYISQAIEKGASAILIDEKDLKETKSFVEVTIIPSSVPRKKYAQIHPKNQAGGTRGLPGDTLGAQRVQLQKESGKREIICLPRGT